MTTYFVQTPCCGAIKIGYTSGPTEERIKSLQTAHAHPLVFIGELSDGVDGPLEPILHGRLHSHRMHGEWFRPERPVIDEIERLLLMQEEEVTQERYDTLRDKWVKLIAEDVTRDFDPVWARWKHVSTLSAALNVGDMLAVARESAQLFALAMNSLRDQRKPCCAFCAKTDVPMAKGAADDALICVRCAARAVEQIAERVGTK